MITVYGLTDEHGQIKYVGQTRRPEVRFRQHVSGKLKSFFRICGLAVLERVVDVKRAYWREQAWIDFFGMDNLFNKAPASAWSEEGFNLFHYGFQYVDDFGRIRICEYEECKGRFIREVKTQRCCTQAHQNQQDELIRHRIRVMLRSMGVGK